MTRVEWVGLVARTAWVEQRFPGQKTRAQELRRAVPVSGKPERVRPFLAAGKGSEGEGRRGQAGPGPPSVARLRDDVPRPCDERAAHRLGVDHRQ